MPSISGNEEKSAGELLAIGKGGAKLHMNPAQNPREQRGQQQVRNEQGQGNLEGLGAKKIEQRLRFVHGMITAVMGCPKNGPAGMRRGWRTTFRQGMIDD